MNAVGYRRPQGVAIFEDASDGDDTVYLAKLPAGPIVVLRDTALVIWREAVAPTGPGSLGARVASFYGVAPEVIESDVDACVSDLLERGVLERSGPPVTTEEPH